MTDTAKGLVLGLIFGAGITLAGGAAVMTLVVTPKINAVIVDVKAAQQKADDQKWSGVIDTVKQNANDNCRAMMSTQHAVDTMSAPATVVPNGYTVLFDTSVSPVQASTSGGYELLNLFRPGLGTMLGKLSQQPTNRRLVPAWFIVGKAPVIFYGDINTALVERLDSKGYPLSQGMPLSAAQIAANPKLLEVSQ